MVWSLRPPCFGLALLLALAGAGCIGRSALDENPAAGAGEDDGSPTEVSVPQPTRRTGPTSSPMAGSPAPFAGMPPPAGTPLPLPFPDEPDAGVVEEDDGGVDSDLDAG